jgi:hypothetical protein
MASHDADSAASKGNTDGGSAPMGHGQVAGLSNVYPLSIVVEGEEDDASAISVSQT